MADKVESEDARANEAIVKLREVATAVKEMGEALADAERTVEEQRARLSDWEERAIEWKDHTDEFERWGSLLGDFKRGIVDRGELLAGTVGR